MKFPFLTPQVRSGPLWQFIPNPAGSKWKRGFTLLEVLIVITLIVLLALALLVFFNPKFQIEKSWDGKRKKELNTLQIVFEEYYNDNNCYPRPEEVCYNTPQQLSSGNYVCNICGNEPAPSNFSNFESYLSRLPCDPQHPTKSYLYEVDNPTCPSLYRVYTRLSNEKDEDISEVGCSIGCAPEGYSVSVGKSYNYGVTSPNTVLTPLVSAIIQYACRSSDGACIQCCTDVNNPECLEPTPCPLLDQDPNYCWIVGSLTTCQANCTPGC